MSQGRSSRYCLRGHDTSVCGRQKGYCLKCKEAHKIRNRGWRSRDPLVDGACKCIVPNGNWELRRTCTCGKFTTICPGCQRTVFLFSDGLCGKCSGNTRLPPANISLDAFWRKPDTSLERYQMS